MSIGLNIARGHAVLKRAFSLVQKNKLLLLYMLGVYGLYVALSLPAVMCIRQGCFYGLSIVNFFAEVVVAYFVLALFMSKLLAIINGQKNPLTSYFLFDRMILGQVLLLAIILGIISTLYVASIGTVWRIGAQLISWPFSLIGKFALLIILDQRVQLVKALKPACYLLWRILGAYICAIVELILIFSAIAIVLGAGAFLWLACYCAWLGVPVLVGLGQHSNLLALLYSPVGITLLAIGVGLFVFFGVLFLVLAAAITTIFYRDGKLKSRE